MASFDFKTALFAKHAQHVVLIHFPIALFMMGMVCDVVAERAQNTMLAIVAYYNLLVAAIAVVPTVLTGVLAWRWALEGAKLKGILLGHLLGGVVLAVSMAIVAWVHIRARHRQRALPRWRLPIEALTFLLLGVTAHLGGFLSGVNG